MRARPGKISRPVWFMMTDPNATHILFAVKALPARFLKFQKIFKYLTFPSPVRENLKVSQGQQSSPGSRQASLR